MSGKFGPFLTQLPLPPLSHILTFKHSVTEVLPPACVTSFKNVPLPALPSSSKTESTFPAEVRNLANLWESERSENSQDFSDPEVWLDICIKKLWLIYQKESPLGYFFIIFPFLRVSSAFNTLDWCLTNQGRLPCSSEGLVALTFVDLLLQTGTGVLSCLKLYKMIWFHIWNDICYSSVKYKSTI